MLKVSFFLCIEINKLDAIKAIEKEVKKYDNIQVVKLQIKYPQGAEKQLIYACTNREVPSGGLPMDVGVVVNNVQPQNKSNGLAVAGFVISLISTFLCCGSLNVISLILSIVGAVKAKDCNGNGKGLAIAGIIISAIGLVLLILFTILGYATSIAESISSSSY